MIPHVNLDNPAGTRVYASDWATTINAAIDALNAATNPTAVTADSAFVATDAGGLFSNTSATNHTKSLIPGLGCVLLVQNSTGTLAVTQGTASALSGVTATTSTQPALLLLEVSAGVYQGIAFAPNNLGSAATHASTDFAPAGAYVKPGTGIPSTDLSTAVQAALTAAGTALQSVPAASASSAGAVQLATGQVSNVLAKIATTGAYGDLSGLPTLGSSASHAATDFAPAGSGAGGAVTAADVQASATALTASRALTTADKAAFLVSNLTTNITLSQMPAGLVRFTVAQANTGTITVTPGAGVTFGGASSTTATTPRLIVEEVLPGVYVGTATAPFPLASNGTSLDAATKAALLASGFLSGTSQLYTGTTVSGLIAAHDVVNLMSYGGFVECQHGAVLTGDVAITNWNFAKVGIKGNGARLDYGSGLPGVLDYTRFNYQWPSAVGEQKSLGRMHTISHLNIHGPGRGGVGSISTCGVVIDGSQDPLGASPCMPYLHVEGFDIAVDLRNRAYLVELERPTLYNNNIAIRQSAALDAGENCSIRGGVIANNRLGFHLLDGSSEWFLYGVSLDYMSQLVVGQGSPCRMQLFGCHVELRGANLGTDNGNYVLDGTGYDLRAMIQGVSSLSDGLTVGFTPISTNTGAVSVNTPPWGAVPVKTWVSTVGGAVRDLNAGESANGVTMEFQYNVANGCWIWNQTRTNWAIPYLSDVTTSDGNSYTTSAIITRDSVVDITGDGSYFLMHGGWWDINGSGGPGPYAFRQLVNVRHVNSKADFRDVSMSNMANTNNCFWTGPGWCSISNLQTAASPSMPTRWTDQGRGNALQDPGIGDGAIEDYWCVTQDTITNLNPPMQMAVTGGAVILATVSGGAVTGLTIVNGGSGYTGGAPTASFSGGGGTGASVTLTVAGGVVTGYTSLVGGSGYTTAPTVVVDGSGLTPACTGPNKIVIASPAGAPPVLLQGHAIQFYAPNANTSTTPTIVYNGTSYNALSFTGSAPSAGTAWGDNELVQFVFDGTSLRKQSHQRLIGRNGIIQRSTTAGARVTGITNLVGGSGYGSAPTVTFSGGGASVQATGHSVMQNGVVVDVIIDSPGLGYTSAPTIAFGAGGGGSGASATAVISSTGALKVTKAGTGSFRFAHFHPVTPNEQVSMTLSSYRPTSGGITGNLYTELRWAKVQGHDLNGRPTVIFKDNYTASATIPATTGAWATHAQDRYQKGASGAVRAPAWATHALLIFNMDSGSAGDIYFDDIAISPTR